MIIMSEVWVQCFTCCVTEQPQAGKHRRRIDRSMIGEPTNFRHTGHIGSGDIQLGQSHLTAIQNQMASKGGYQYQIPVNIPIAKMDELLRCGICYEYLNITMMTTCSHNYCSVCIRKYMSYKSACPACFVVTSEPELKTNRVLDQLVQNFVALRSKLLRALNSYSEPSNKRKSQVVEPIATKRRKEEYDDQTSERLNEDLFTNINDRVECPICTVKISSRNIDRHVEDCLNKADNIPREKDEKKCKPLPKLIYHLMSDKDLKGKLKQHGLNTLGDRNVLIKRHHSFTILYNANSDSLKPRPISALVRQVEKEERITAPKPVKVNFPTRKEDPGEQEHQSKGYLKEHKSQFDKLIENIKQRSKNKLTSTQTLNEITKLPSEIIESIQEPPCKIVESSVSETDLDTSGEDDDIIAPSPPNNFQSTSSFVYPENSSSSTLFSNLQKSPIITSHYQTDNEELYNLGHSPSHQNPINHSDSDSNSSEDSISLLQ
uniref:RING-type E3 ubiquitin transferase n=1 Tax=Strigamia maritima TaxID=126957 RepID=T1J842_STRMM